MAVGHQYQKDDCLPSLQTLAIGCRTHKKRLSAKIPNFGSWLSRLKRQLPAKTSNFGSGLSDTTMTIACQDSKFWQLAASNENTDYLPRFQILAVGCQIRQQQLPVKTSNFGSWLSNLQRTIACQDSKFWQSVVEIAKTIAWQDSKFWQLAVEYDNDDCLPRLQILWQLAANIERMIACQDFDDSATNPKNEL